MAEREGFEPPIALRLCLISSQVHSTGLCHLSARVLHRSSLIRRYQFPTFEFKRDWRLRFFAPLWEAPRISRGVKNRQRKYSLPAKRRGLQWPGCFVQQCGFIWRTAPFWAGCAARAKFPKSTRRAARLHPYDGCTLFVVPIGSGLDPPGPVHPAERGREQVSGGEEYEPESWAFYDGISHFAQCA